MSADENQINISGSVIVNDPEGDALNYSVSGNDFNISNAGIITFKTAPDYETKNYYEAEITVSDAQLSSSATIKVNINNVNEAPIFTSSATFSVAENQTAIGTVTASDVDNGSSLTYSISGSELAISSTGVISFLAAPNYETKTSYTATVSVSDGGLTATQDLTININNVLEDVIAYTADISDGTNSVVPKLTASITIDELTLAKKVYIQLQSVASSQGIDCNGQKTFEMSKTNSTLWDVSKDIYLSLIHI